MKKFELFIVLFLIALSPLLGENNATNISQLKSEEFFVQYVEHIDKLQSRLTLANHRTPSEVVGTEVVEGYLSGTLTYEAHRRGMGIDVTVKYDNFSDEEGWIFDGVLISHVRIIGKGSYEGEIKVEGLYKAKVLYSNVKSTLGYPSEGTYGVILNDEEVVNIDYKNAIQDKKA